MKNDASLVWIIERSGFTLQENVKNIHEQVNKVIEKGRITATDRKIIMKRKTEDTCIKWIVNVISINFRRCSSVLYESIHNHLDPM